MIYVDRSPGVRLVTDRVPLDPPGPDPVEEWYADHLRREAIYDACRRETDSTAAWLVCVEARS